MEDIRELLRRLAEGVDRVIVNKETLKALQAAGLKLVEPPQLSVEEDLDLRFSDRRQRASELATMLPTAPVVQNPSVSYIYEQTRECILFGLFGAAITLSGVLVEYALKYAAITRKTGSGEYDPAMWDEFENLTFDSAIKRARNEGVITKDEVKKLQKFKKDVRDPYTHYNIKRITQNVTAKGVKRANILTGELETADIAAKDDLVIMAQAKPFVDSQMVLTVFRFANEIVGRLLERIATR